MEIIPAVNCKDFACVSEKIKQIKEFKCSWAHIDVSDGEFAPTLTWNNPDDLLGLEELSEVNLEIHLMINDPQGAVEDWLRVGAKRIIIHEEALFDGWPIILDKIATYGAELVLSLKPETPAKNVFPYLKSIFAVQFLAVSPGPSGQEFKKEVLQKIKLVKKENPATVVEIDGGINLKTAKLAKAAGADILVSGSYIWQSGNPSQAYEALKTI